MITTSFTRKNSNYTKFHTKMLCFPPFTLEIVIFTPSFIQKFSVCPFFLPEKVIFTLSIRRNSDVYHRFHSKKLCLHQFSYENFMFTPIFTQKSYIYT